MTWESEDMTADYHSFEAKVFLGHSPFLRYGAMLVHGLHLID